MKKNKHKLLKLFALIGIILIVFISSCRKDVFTNDSTEPITEFINYSLGCELLPATEYAKINQAKAPNVTLKISPLNLTVPPVRNQGGEGSCVAFGTTYAARSIDWQASHNAPWSQSVNIFSPEFVYNQIKAGSSCGSGAYVVTGLNLLKNSGVCTWTSMPYTDVSCSLMPNFTQNSEALNYVISNYNSVAITTSAIKSFLSSGKPVIVAGHVNNDFVNLKNNAVLTTYKGKTLGGHCYCVIGYDDSKSAFKFMNSWGTTWASAGFGYIAYSKITSWWSEAYVIN